jgi:hypothetical protein
MRHYPLSAAFDWNAFCRGLLVVFFSLGLAQPGLGARLSDLYSAEVEVSGPQRDLDSAFADALAQVVVKVTGRRAGEVAASLPSLGDPATLVQQYRNISPGQLSVGFDALALRRALDAAGLPFWGEERPATLVWLAMDAGRGQRDILAAADQELPVNATGDDAAAAARSVLLDSAAARGLPLILPLVDGEDLQLVNFADLWGDFTEPVLEASQRYRADAVLIGRARGTDLETARVRWSLLTGDERIDWNGSVASGPDEAADILAARLAAGPGAARALLVAVEGIDSLANYGNVTQYLSALSNVDACEVVEVAGDRVLYNLRVRGDVDQLMRVIALRRLLAPVDPVPGAATADLYYSVIGG